MKNSAFKRLMISAVVTIMTFLTLASSVQARCDDKSKVVTSKKYAKNLSLCISSQNEGVKNEAIYFAGKYKVAGTTKALVQQLKKEESQKTRALIVYSLLRIGDEDGISAAYQYANVEMDEYIRKVFSEVTAEFDSVKSLAVYKKDAQ
jgi:HEAT repeat protein